MDSLGHTLLTHFVKWELMSMLLSVPHQVGNSIISAIGPMKSQFIAVTFVTNIPCRKHYLIFKVMVIPLFFTLELRPT